MTQVIYHKKKAAVEVKTFNTLAGLENWLDNDAGQAAVSSSLPVPPSPPHPSYRSQSDDLLSNRHNDVVNTLLPMTCTHPLTTSLTHSTAMNGAGVAQLASLYHQSAGKSTKHCGLVTLVVIVFRHASSDIRNGIQLLHNLGQLSSKAAI